MDEALIIAKCQQGNLEYFGELFDLYHKKIYNFIYFRTLHKETAEDLTSLTFAKTLEHLQNFDAQKGSFSSWLYQIARNCVIDHYRSLPDTQNITDAWDLPANADVQRDADTAIQLEKVKKYLSSLPARQRDIILMRVWDGFSHKEIAEILKISEANSKMIFSRTLEKLRTEMDLMIICLLLMSIR